MGVVVECEHLFKRYGDVIAVHDVSFTLEEGEIFGLVGPNGAGKTTLIETLESLRKPDSGFIRVLGLDPTREAGELKEKIGVQLQTTSIQPHIKVKEAIRLFAGLYRHPLANPDELLQTLSLEDKSDSHYVKLSGGQKQRVAIALALVNNPSVLFFDEITTGLDPQARRNMWGLVKEIRSRGKTIFLTTHYMEEAEELCDRVGVMDHGKIMALDTPRNLVRNLGAESKVLFRVDGRDVAAAEFMGLPTASRVEKVEDGFVIYARDASVILQDLLRFADARKFKLSGLRTEMPRLDDVFLTLTGRELRE